MKCEDVRPGGARSADYDDEVTVSAPGPAPARRAQRWGAAAWIAILLLIGVVQIIRAQWFDAAVFLVAAPLLAVDAVRRARRAPDAQPGRSLPPVRWAVILLVATGAAAMLLPRHALPMQLLLVAAGGLLIVWAWPQRPGGSAAWSPGPRRLAWSWALIVIAGCIWELGEFIVGLLRPAQPAYALSDLLDPLLAARPGRLLFVVVWIAGGLFLALRGRR